MEYDQNTPPESRKPWQRLLSWLLISLMANPAVSVPLSLYAPSAQARDTDIYMAATYAGDIAEPAILLVLDTSDSMNIPEPWREYDPDTYDSHVEYLPNNYLYINSYISSSDPSSGDYHTAGSSAGAFGPTWVYNSNSTTPMNNNTLLYDAGWWTLKGYNGSSHTAANFKSAVRNYTMTTHDPDGAGPLPADPGPRYLYRNYSWTAYSLCGGSCNWRGGGMFLYWVPLEGRDANDPAIENDPRLRADSFNKIWGAAQVTAYGNTRTGTNVDGTACTYPNCWPVMRGGIAYGKAAPDGADPYIDYRSLNKCGASLAALEPSTVYAPSAQPKNAGKMLNQRWVRWGLYERLNDTRAWFGDTTVDNISTGVGFKGSDTIVTDSSNGFTYYTGYLGGQRDLNQKAYCSNGNPTMPVRTRIDTGTAGVVDAGDSYAGWANLAPDYGGLNMFYARLATEYGGDACTAPGNAKTILENAIRIYYPNAATYPAGANLGEALTYAKKYFPAPDYYDTPSNLVVTSGSTPGVSVTKTRNCTSSGRTLVYDVYGTEKYYGGSCNNAGADSCNDTTGDCYCNNADSALCALLADPPNCGFTYDNNFYTRDNRSCVWKSPSPRQSVTKDYHGCAWHNRRDVTVEGVGTYYYGGDCKGDCSGDICENKVNDGENYCIKSTSGDIWIAPHWRRDYRMDSATAGCTDKADVTWWYGSTCTGEYRTVSTPYATQPVVNPPALSGGYAASSDAATCTVTPSMVDTRIDGNWYRRIRTDGAATGCGDTADTNSTCMGLFGVQCNTCPAKTSTGTVGGSAGGTTNYTVFGKAAAAMNYIVDCKADDGTANNPGNGYLRDSWTRPASFGTAYNTSSATGSNNNSYSTNAGHAIPDGNIPPINVYHPNYLNWKFGAKACRNNATNALLTSTALINGTANKTCRPIGRKTRIQIAKDALVDLVQNTNGVRFGLLVFNRTSDSSGGFASEGGNIAYAIQRMNNDDGTPNTTNRNALISKINGITASARTPLTETMYEAYRYFKGEAPVYGTSSLTVGGVPVTYGNDNAHAVSGGNYVSPMLSNPSTATPSPCQKNYVLLVTDGGPEDDSAANDAVRALNIGGVRTTQATGTGQFEDGSGTPYGTADMSDPLNPNYIWLDELTYFMANADISPFNGVNDALRGKQNVKTYTVGFAGGNTPVLRQAATAGGGVNYVADDSASLAAALSAVIQNIKSWNPVAVQAVPIGGLNSASSSDDIYMGFFKPDTNITWVGTLKKYKFSTEHSKCGDDADGNAVSFCLTGQGPIADVSGTNWNIVKYTLDPFADVDVDGNFIPRPVAEIKPQAVSYWSNPPVQDGSKPDMGGSGLMLQTLTASPNTRNVYTFIDGVGLTPLRGDNTSITLAMVGAADEDSKHTLINYARGGDPAFCNTTADCLNWRTWSHADVLHSRPNVLTYQVEDDPADSNHDLNFNNDFLYTQTVFYMTNDGLLHAVDAATGREFWSFMPEEVLPQLNTLKTGGQGEHINAADGSPTLYYRYTYVNGLARVQEALLFFGLRRGGRAYYALDVTNRDTPRFLWKIRNDQLCTATACNSSTDFAELGETWSTPFVSKLRDVPGVPALVFGAGYDPKPNDLVDARITLDSVSHIATVTTDVDHGYAAYNSTGSNKVIVSGATESQYNGTYDITVTGDRTFTYTVAGSPASPATGAIKVVSAEEATMGRGVFVVNARTGALIRSYTPAATSGANVATDIHYSMPSDAVPLNTDFDGFGYVDRLYMGDLGGNLWRFNLDDEVGDGAILWDVPTKFADTNGMVAPGTALRKIMFPPAVVRGLDYDEVYIGTGDRENPLRADIADKFFMFKDRSPGLHVPDTFQTITYGEASLYNITNHQTTIDEDAMGAPSNNGWVLDLDTQGTHTEPGEKVVSAPTVFDNIVQFSTYSPRLRPSLCLPYGKGSNYMFYASSGLVMDINGDGVVNNQDSRYDPNFITRGMPGSSGLLVRDNKLWRLTSGDTNNRIEETGTAGVGRGVYWYQEPED